MSDFDLLLYAKKKKKNDGNVLNKVVVDEICPTVDEV